VTGAIVLLPAGRFLALALLVWAGAVVALLATTDPVPAGAALGTPARRVAPARALGALAVVAVAAPALAHVLPDPPGRGAPRLGAGTVDEENLPAVASGAFASTDRMDTAVRVSDDGRELLRIRADRQSLWRGQVFDTWDGRTWTLGPGLVDRDRVTARTEFEAANRYGIDVQEQRVTVVSPTDVIVAAPRLVDHAAPVRTQRDRDGTILADRPMPPGTTYRVTSAVLRVGTAELDAAGAGGGPDPGVRYRALPPVPDRVADLARSLTADAPTVLSKVRAVEAWLAVNTVYTLDIPPLPDGADAVEHFLFEDRRGYCQQVASAFAVLLRLAGVPTRVATGVVAGDRDELTGEWIVRGRDAHAWVEVWFPGIGWQGVDPTASVPLGGRGDAGSALADALAAAVPGLVVALVVLVVVAAAALGGRRRRHRRPWVATQVAALDRVSATAGRARHPATPLTRHAADLAGGPLDHPDLPGAVRVLERSLYDAHEPAPEERRLVEGTVRELRRAARPRWRRRRPDRSG
jgi:transglutaminase-like putative cysteine protease